MCQEFCPQKRGGVRLNACWDTSPPDRHPHLADNPLGTHPLCRYLPWVGTPLGRHSPADTPLGRHHLGRYTTLGRHPLGQTSLSVDTPLGRHPLGQTPSGQTRPQAGTLQQTPPWQIQPYPLQMPPWRPPPPSLETATAADGMRPTGMLSCLLRFFLGSLQSGNLWKLAQRITNEEELRELGSALKIHDYKLDTAIANATNIQLAAYRILQTWSKGFESSKEAQTTLLKSLKQCGMNKLAALLK